MNKLQKYVNEIEKFLNKKYFCYPLKIQKYDYKNNKNGTEIMKNYFIIETKNAGLVMIRPDLFTCSKPYKYDLFTQKWAYEWADKKEKIFTHRQIYDGKFKKNNIYAKESIDFIKWFITSEYQSTKEQQKK